MDIYFIWYNMSFALNVAFLLIGLGGLGSILYLILSLKSSRGESENNLEGDGPNRDLDVDDDMSDGDNQDDHELDAEEHALNFDGRREAMPRQYDIAAPSRAMVRRMAKKREAEQRRAYLVEMERIKQEKLQNMLLEREERDEMYEELHAQEEKERLLAVKREKCWREAVKAQGEALGEDNSGSQVLEQVKALANKKAPLLSLVETCEECSLEPLEAMWALKHVEASSGQRMIYLDEEDALLIISESHVDKIIPMLDNGVSLTHLLTQIRSKS
jgi:hypothetical protein